MVVRRTSRVSSVQNLEVLLQGTRLDDAIVSLFIKSKHGPKDDVLANCSMLEPCTRMNTRSYT